MTVSEYLKLDMDASLAKLAEWLSRYGKNGYDFTEDSRRHRGLAERLKAMAATLEDDEWFFLESEFEKDPSPDVAPDGTTIPYSGNNALRYKILISQLRELSETADRLADENPRPRTKPELPMAADFFLHLWLAAGKDRPALYDHNEAVQAFKDALSKAGYIRSDERVRGILASALEKFDPFLCVDQWQLDQFMVWRQ